MLDELFIRGGPVLYVLFLLTLIIAFLFINKYLYIFNKSQKLIEESIKDFSDKYPPATTDFKFLKEKVIASIKRESNKNLKVLEGFIGMCPMIGLLGTVYGMIEVFEVLSFLGTGNPRAMSSGVAMATIPTMSGMVITIFGLYFRQDIVSRINKISDSLYDNLKEAGYKLWEDDLEINL